MHTCQWIFGDPLKPGWRFCGKPVRRADESWCKEHYWRVYQVEPSASDRKLAALRRQPQQRAA